MAATPRDQYLDWKKRRGDVGCIFARYLASKPNEFGQRLQVVNGTTPAAIAAAIESHVDAWIADARVIAATLLLPDVIHLTSLAQVALALEKTQGWLVSTLDLPATPVGPLVAFRMTREVPVAHGSLPSEALVLGSFDVFPPTRKAPVTALEIFVGPPPAIDPKTKAAPQKANLAHVSVTPPVPPKVYDGMWNKTIAARLHSLGGADDPRAKAKIAFVVPPTLAQALGCKP